MYYLNPEQAAGLKWRKASRSGGGDCVELAAAETGVAIRHSKNTSGPALLYTRTELAAFLDGAKKGEFDDLCN
jgi:hypothetical protein